MASNQPEPQPGPQPVPQPEVDSEPQPASPGHSNRSHYTWRSGAPKSNDDQVGEFVNQVIQHLDEHLGDQYADPPAIRDHLHVLTHVLLPAFFGILFLITATAVSVYTLAMKVVIPRGFLRALGALFAVVVGLWCVGATSLYFRGKRRADRLLDEINEKREQEQLRFDLEHGGHFPEPKEVICPLRKRRIQAAAIKGGKFGWGWSLSQWEGLKKAKEKWKASRKARAEQRQKAFGIRPPDEENITPVPATSVLMDIGSCRPKPTQTFESMSSSTCNQKPEPSRSFMDKIFCRNKHLDKKVSDTEKAAKNQERIAEMFRRREFATYESSAHDIVDVDRLVASGARKSPEPPRTDPRRFGAGRWYQLQEPPRAKLQHQRPTRYSKARAATWLSPQSNRDGKMTKRVPREKEISVPSQGNASSSQDVPFSSKNHAATAIPIAVCPVGNCTRVERRTQTQQDKAISTAPPSQTVKDHPDRGSSNVPALPQLSSSLRPSQALQRQPSRIDRQENEHPVPPVAINMTINTLHLPPESEMNHPSTIFLGTQPDTMTNPQRCSITASASRSKMPQESTTLNQSGLALGLHPWTSKRNPHRKPLIPRKALSDIPEVSSLPISPQPFVMALEKLKTISKRSLKRKLGRENLRFKSLTRRSRAKDRISRCRLRRSGSRLTSSVARASRRSESHKLWCGEEAREILAEILGETCPSSYQFPPAPPAAEVESFTVASLKLPNKRDSWLTIDSNDGWESSVSGAVRHSKSQAVEDVSGRNSLNIASGTDLEMSDENVSVKIFSRALRLPPIGIDLKETAGADGNRI